MLQRITYIEPRHVRVVLFVMLFAVAAMRLWLVFVHEANWDEYLNLAMIYDHQRGELREVLQTGFVHLFGWVTYVSDNEADQIIAVRLVYFAVGVITSVAIWKTTRALVSTEGALFSVLCYWAFSYNLVHGVSLRTDPLAASAMMCALCATISGPPLTRTVFVTGGLAGLAGFFTIKAIFYTPALAAVILIRRAEGGSIARGVGTVLLAGFVAVVVFISLSAVHAMTFSEIASPFAFLDRTTGSTLGTQTSSILKRYLQQALRQNSVVFGMMLIGAVGLVIRLRRVSDRTQGLLGFALLTPILSFLVYRDTYPYYYPFILASGVILVGIAWDDLRRRYGARIPIVISVVICLGAVVVTVEKTQRNIATQRLTLDVVHRLFPDDARYIDGRSMVSSFSKRGPFMSTWGMTDYRLVGRPVMADILRLHQPQFVLANTWHLQMDQMSPSQSENRRLGLLAADMSTLQDNFAQFWGPLYVPAKSIVAGEQSMHVLVSGTYRLIAEAPVFVDGKRLAPDVEIWLETKEYLVSASRNAQLILNVERPSDPPPTNALFDGF